MSIQTLSKITIGLGISAIVLIPTSANALIDSVTTTTNMGTFRTYNLSDLTNGDGLSELSSTATHGNSFDTMWLSNTGNTTGFLDFDLGSVSDVSEAYVWNYNSNGSLNRSVQNITVDTSIDGVNFNNLLGTTTLSQGTGNAISPDTLNLSNVTARYIRFNIQSNYGSPSYSGLSEVQFNDVPQSASVPFEFSPSLGLVLMGGLFGVSRYTKSRKASKLIELE